jgi:hypothetical protein
VLWVDLVEFHVCTVLIDCGQLGQSVADSSHNCFEATWGVSAPYIEIFELLVWF